jgi:hypothetical protein
MKLTVGVKVISPSFALNLILQQNKLEFIALSNACYAGKMFIKLTPEANAIKLFVRNLLIFVISSGACHWQAFLA